MSDALRSWLPLLPYLGVVLAAWLWRKVRPHQYLVRRWRRG